MLLLLILSFLSYAAVPYRLAKIPQKDWIDPRDFGAVGISEEVPGSIDILIAGDSESYTGISPYRLWEKQKITSYICGQSAQHTVEAYYMLKQAFSSQHPKLVILETDELFTCAGLKGEAELAVTETLEHYFPVLSYHSRWKETVGLSEPVQLPQDETSYKGFQIRKSARPVTQTGYMEQTAEAAFIRLPVKFYLKKIYELCRQHDCDMLLLSIPSPMNWNMQKHNATAAWAREYGIPFLDLNTETEKIAVDWQKDSYDGGDHLNLSGAEKVTDYLGEYLNDHYDLSSFRRDRKQTIQSLWDNALKKYQEAVRNAG